jgi:hypothetical protein
MLDHMRLALATAVMDKVPRMDDECANRRSISFFNSDATNTDDVSIVRNTRSITIICVIISSNTYLMHIMLRFGRLLAMDEDR